MPLCAPLRFPEDVPTLTRGDVTIRAHRPGDVDAIVEQCTDPVSVRWTTVPLEYDRPMAVDWIANVIEVGWETGSEHLFAIECTHPDGVRRFAGSLSLRDEGLGRAELAYGAHPAVRGRGVMTTAVGLVLDHGFDTLGLETIIWWAEEGNLGSRKVAWRNGFTFAGTVRRWMDHRGAYPNGWVGSLHRDDPRRPRGLWWDIPVLETASLVLRRHRAGDDVRIAQACSDERTQQWLPFLPSPYSLADAVSFRSTRAAMAATGDVVSWAVTDLASDRLLATVGLQRKGERGFEIGYWAHPDARGRGVVSAAVGRVLDAAFASESDGGYGAYRVFARAAIDNPASQHVLHSNGFVGCGRESRSDLRRDGERVDLLVFERLATD